MGKIFILLAMLAASEIYNVFAAEHAEYRTQVWSTAYLNDVGRTKLLELTNEKAMWRARGGSLFALAVLSCEKEKVSNLLRYVGLCDLSHRRRLQDHETKEKNKLRAQLEAQYILGPESFGVGRENIKIGQEGLLLFGAIETEKIERGVVFRGQYDQ